MCKRFCHCLSYEATEIYIMDKFRRGLEKARASFDVIRCLSSTSATLGQNNSLPTDLKRFLEEVCT